MCSLNAMWHVESQHSGKSIQIVRTAMSKMGFLLEEDDPIPAAREENK